MSINQVLSVLVDLLNGVRISFIVRDLSWPEIKDEREMDII